MGAISVLAIIVGILGIFSGVLTILGQTGNPKAAAAGAVLIGITLILGGILLLV